MSNKFIPERKQTTKAIVMRNPITKKNTIPITCIFAFIAVVVMLSSNSKKTELKPLPVLYKIERQKKNDFTKNHNQTPSALTLIKNKPRGSAGELFTVSDYEAHSSYGSMPEHMSGLEIDGGFKTDVDGNLVISHENKQLFDFFLSTANQESIELCAERIREYILLTLPEKAGDQALELFASYLNYKGQLNDFYKEADEMNRYVSKPDKLSLLKNTLEQTMSFRRDLLGDKVSDAFFSDEEAIADYTIESMSILSSPDLSESKKELLRAEAQKALPASMSEDMTMYEEEQEFATTIAELKTDSENKDRIFELRAQRYGKEAAKRLDKLDSKRNKLKERYQSFCLEVKENPDYSHLSEEELSEKINELKKSEFKEWELANLSSVKNNNSNL